MKCGEVLGIEGKFGIRMDGEKHFHEYRIDREKLNGKYTFHELFFLGGMDFVPISGFSQYN